MYFCCFWQHFGARATNCSNLYVCKYVHRIPALCHWLMFSAVNYDIISIIFSMSLSVHPLWWGLQSFVIKAPRDVAALLSITRQSSCNVLSLIKHQKWQIYFFHIKLFIYWTNQMQWVMANKLERLWQFFWSFIWKGSTFSLLAACN